MPWMLQPKSYTQIARPNLYNVAYRRVGTYKGMGRLNPTNYLQIGTRPNRIGATTGQYNTLSGQLSLLPPSLRGLGQGQCPGNPGCPGYVAPGSMDYQTSLLQEILTNQATAQGQAPVTPTTDTTGTANWTPWIILAGGLLLVSLMVGGRR